MPNMFLNVGNVDKQHAIELMQQYMQKSGHELYGSVNENHGFWKGGFEPSVQIVFYDIDPNQFKAVQDFFHRALPNEEYTASGVYHDTSLDRNPYNTSGVDTGPESAQTEKPMTLSNTYWWSSLVPKRRNG